MWRAVVPALLALSGCTLSSRTPLITEPTVIPELTDGSYQPYVAVDPKSLGKVRPKKRADCLTPGYRFRDRVAERSQAGAWVETVYCPFDADDGERFPILRITRDGTTYRSEQTGPMAFQRVRGSIFLWQSHSLRDGHPAGSGEKNDPSFDYWLVRPNAFGLDVSGLFCDYFPSLKRDTRVPAEPADPLPNRVKSPAGQRALPDAALAEERGRATCEATSLAAIRPELDAVAARAEIGDEPVVLLLRRQPSGVPSR